ncbi:Phage tail protein [Sphingomonas aurantiaca]|uniref:Phage tail protein n=1 Tax=Sphingomonas aurantiaca TaxID=185949 RepID=A0A5E7YQE2_9SPHN|nr:phage tail protein [Sphingomonas aurantiaca]VVT08957.1 Phage tail protein [Sphingomonas aurantiaca]
MGKVLKIMAVIAIAAAVAYFAPQLAPSFLQAAIGTTAATAAVAAALSIAASAAFSLLAGKPSAGAATPSIFRQAISNSFIIYGLRRVGGLLIFFHPVGKEYRYFVIAVAGHRCKGVARWYLGDDEVTVDATGKVTSGVYANNAWLWFYRGTADQQAHPLFVAETQGKWTANHCGRDTALIYAKFKMTDDVVQAGMPNITAEVEGKDNILDPRTDHRIYTRNAALVFYDWMALAREEGGFGCYPDEIDWDWVAAQANVCDEDVPLAAGGTEKRYEFDSYLQTGAAPSEVRETFVACCAGAFTYTGGKMLMRPGYYVPPSATLLESDLAGAITVPCFLASDETANEVSGTYIDPTNLYQPKDVPTRSIDADEVRQITVDLPHVTSGPRAQRILEYRLRKAQAERRVTWPMNIVGISVSTLDSVQLATSRYGLSNYTFQTISWGLSQDFGVVLSLEEHSPELFDWNTSMERAIGQVGDLVAAEPINEFDGAVIDGQVSLA